MKYLVANFRVTTLSSVYDIIVGGDAVGFQTRFAAFLQEYLALFCAPHHKEKVYQTMCYMLIYALFGKEYDIRMEQESRMPAMDDPTLRRARSVHNVCRHSFSR